jgi:hypothetical protein
MFWYPSSLLTICFLHFLWVVSLISSEVIVPIAYLGSWTLVALVIASKFLLDSHLFLLEAIGASNLGPLLFQAYLASMRKLLPLKATTCVPSYEQLVEKNVDHLKESISKRLHDHSFINILFYLPYNLHQTHLRSCEGLDVGAWMLACPIIPFFCLPSNVFSTTLHTRLGFSHPLMLGVSHCICS